LKTCFLVILSFFHVILSEAKNLFAGIISTILSLWGWSGQASSEDLLPLGYGEWGRTKVRVIK
jgi:hypothetical protein